MIPYAIALPPTGSPEAPTFEKVEALRARQRRKLQLKRSARAIKRDIAAVCNAMAIIWSNGKTEGQINRLKTLRRTMHRRAGIELLRARPRSQTAFIKNFEKDPLRAPNLSAEP